MVVRNQTREPLPLTGFGSELYALLASRGVRTLSGLSRLLDAGEVRFSRQQLASYANGTRRVPTSLPRRLVEALELDEEETVRLAKAVSFGQPDHRVTYDDRG